MQNENEFTEEEIALYEKRKSEAAAEIMQARKTKAATSLMESYQRDLEGIVARTTGSAKLQAIIDLKIKYRKMGLEVS